MLHTINEDDVNFVKNVRTFPAKNFYQNFLAAVLLALPNIREFGNRQRRRRKPKSLIPVVYKSAHTLLDFNCLLKDQSFI